MVPVTHDPVRYSIVIPVRNGSGTLERCLSAARSAALPGTEIIVVDDGSTDDSAAIASRVGVRLIQNGSPLGAAASRNRGASVARGEFIVFTDADVLLPATTFQRLDHAFGAPNVHAVIGLLSARTPVENFVSRYENYYMHRQYACHDPDIAILYTSAAAVRAAVFRSSGGFDENYRGASIEDMELGHRLVSRGTRIHLLKDWQVVHLKRFSLKTLARANFNKASGTLKIKLRNRSSGISASGLVAPPAGFLAGIPLTGLAAVCLVAAATFRLPLPGALAAACLVAMWSLNAGWIAYLLRTAGPWFAVLSLGMLVINNLVYGLGIAAGTVTFIAGKRY